MFISCKLSKQVSYNLFCKMSILATMFKFATSRPCKTFLREVHLLTFIKKRRFTVQKATLRARSRISRDWSPKFATWLNMIIGCSSKSIWVIKLSFCQNDSLLENHFDKTTAWFLIYLLNYSLLLYLAKSQILVISLYVNWY